MLKKVINKKNVIDSFVSTMKNNFKLMGRLFRKTVNEQQVCICMYIFLCEHCVITLNIQKEGGDVVSVKNFKWTVRRQNAIIFCILY